MTGLELCGLLLCVRASVHYMKASAHNMPKIHRYCGASLLSYLSHHCWPSTACGAWSFHLFRVS